MTYGPDGFTFCGPRSYSITPSTYSFLSLSGDGTLTLVSTDPSEETITPVITTIEATLDDYPAIARASQSFRIRIICQLISLSWSTSLPSTYTHVLLVDSVPAQIPFAVDQSPQCGEVLTYSLIDGTTGLAAPPWVSAASGTHLKLTPTSLSLVGLYSFDLSVFEVATGVTSTTA